MKKLLAVLALTLGVAASAQAQGNGSFLIPSDANKNVPADLNFVGARVSSGTVAGTLVSNTAADTQKLFYAGPGIFYGVEIATGAVTAYVQCFDASSASALDQSQSAIALMMPCFPNTTNSGQCGSGTTLSGAGPLLGRYFKNGLVCLSRITVGNSPWQPYVPVYRKASE